MFVRISDETIVTREELLEQTSTKGWVFSSVDETKYIIDAGYAVLRDPGQPEYDIYTQRVDYTLSVDTESGDYVKQYTIADLTPEEILAKLNHVKKTKLEEIASARFIEETSGLTVNGVFFKTDRESRNLINGAVTAINMDPNFTTRWKSGSDDNIVFVTVDKDDILNIAQIVLNHVKECFGKESILHERVHTAQTVQEVLDISWETPIT